MDIILKLFLTGILFGSGPCLVSCGPLLAGFITGRGKTPIEAVKIYLIFSLSRILVYMVLSLAVFFFGKMVAQNVWFDFSDFTLIFAGFFLIVIGSYFILGKRMEIKPFNLVYKYIVKGDNKNIVILGLLSGLLPCAPFMAVLTYIGLVSKNLVQNFVYTFSFGLGTLLSALLLVSFASGLISPMLKNKKQVYQRIISIIAGIVVIFLGLQLIRGAFL